VCDVLREVTGIEPKPEPKPRPKSKKGEEGEFGEEMEPKRMTVSELAAEDVKIVRMVRGVGEVG
jgi:hypothetical protein